MLRRPSASAKAAIFIFTASLVGICLSAWLTYLHIRVHIDPTYVSVCALGERVNCETVAASSYSVFFGLPVSIWGLIAYLAAAILAIYEYKRVKHPGVSGSLAVLSVFMVVFSMILAIISTFVIGAVCLFCTATYVVNFAIAAVAVTAARKCGGVFVCLSAEFAIFRKNPWPAIYSALGLAIILVAGPLGAFPRYWELASWRDGPMLPHGFDEEGYPWLGALNPKIVIHEYFDYECPHCRAGHRKLRRLLSSHSDEVRIVRHDFARMSCAPNDAEQRFARCSMARAAYCAGKNGRYWHWNDAVYASPKPLMGPRRQTYELDMAERLGFDKTEFDTCMFTVETVDFVQQAYLYARKKRVLETPSYRVGEKRLNLSEVADLID
ncbi:MAG: thioredoxin domain-containing protein [Proteobacteria bacterium]|nr:thioredoxin domain-containing protein [Pseudomonadota bacterium]